MDGGLGLGIGVLFDVIGLLITLFVINNVLLSIAFLDLIRQGKALERDRRRAGRMR